MTDEFENALAWFAAAPRRIAQAAKHDLSVTAEWIWEVLQGDFNDDASVTQIAVGTVISMIPFVDQICDVRDVIANCKKIKKEPSSPWLWVALILTLIGLFPTLGSLVKGCGKVMFSSIRKAGYLSGALPELAKAVENALGELNKFIGRPEVQKTLDALKIDNVYKYLSGQLKNIRSLLSTPRLLKCFDDVLEAANSLLNLVKKYGGSQLAGKVGELQMMSQEVRKLADSMLPRFIKDANEVVDTLVRRLDVEADMLHRAHLNTVNPHAFTKITETAEVAAFAKAQPTWVDHTGTMKHQQELAIPIPPSPEWTSLGKAHDTFEIGTAKAIIIPPGEKLYRVLDPKSYDNSICWMSETEFKKITGKDDWRRRFAVWVNWNSNGEFVTYVVPPGQGLHVWEGVAASQKIKGTQYVLEGGARQIVVDPSHMDIGHMGKRQKTNWGYDDLGQVTSLVGVPTLTNNFR